MSKFLKFNIICSLEVSVKVSHLKLVQRMYNSNINNTVCKNENCISDSTITPEDLNRRALTTFNDNRAENCIEESANYKNFNPFFVNPFPSVQNTLWPAEQCTEESVNYNYNPFFAHWYPSVQDTLWPAGQCTQESVNYNYNPFFANWYQSVQANLWPFYNHFNYLYPNYYYRAPIYYHGSNHSLRSTRSFHTQQKYQKNSRHRFKRFGMDIMSLRSWEKIQEHPSQTPGFIFTLMSYNVLAQDLVDQHPYLYSMHDSQSLDWSMRWNNLHKEISKFEPDILCLQEVQESHINEYYSRLEALGFSGIFKKRTGSQSDGCAIYYKTDKVEMIEHSLVEFFQPSVSVLDRDNVGIIAKFVPKLHPTREFVVATTHLLYNPRRSDVRLAQMHLLLTHVDKMSYRQDKENSSYLPIIVTGDLNSPPNSDVYDFVTKGKLKYENLSPKLLHTHTDSDTPVLVTSCLGITDNSQYLDVVEKRSSTESIIINLDKTQINEKRKSSVTNNNLETGPKNKMQACKEDSKGTKSLSHNFRLKSVYNHGSIDNNEGTTHQDEWLTVDYIFYSGKKANKTEEDKLKLLSRYRLPKRKELDSIRIPNKYLGSDHLSLIAKFKLEF